LVVVALAVLALQETVATVQLVALAHFVLQMVAVVDVPLTKVAGVVASLLSYLLLEEWVQAVGVAVAVVLVFQVFLHLVQQQLFFMTE
jgi:hypothetical protein